MSVCDPATGRLRHDLVATTENYLVESKRKLDLSVAPTSDILRMRCKKQALI